MNYELMKLDHIYDAMMPRVVDYTASVIGILISLC
jgi:hypothetical protein